MIRDFRGREPQIPASAYVAENYSGYWWQVTSGQTSTPRPILADVRAFASLSVPASMVGLLASFLATSHLRLVTGLGH